MCASVAGVCGVADFVQHVLCCGVRCNMWATSGSPLAVGVVACVFRLHGVTSGEGGYRDAVTNLINSSFKRNDNGKLIMHINAPLLVEARTRTQRHEVGNYHEGHSVSSKSNNTHHPTHTHKHFHIESSCNTQHTQ